MTTRQGLGQARRAAGYTQEDLAEALHLAASTISRWETGEHEPLPYVRPKLARLLGLSTAELDTLLAEQSPPITPVSPTESTGIDMSPLGRRSLFTNGLVVAASASLVTTGAPNTDAHAAPAMDDEAAIPMPAGRFFAGTSIPARTYPAHDDGRVLVSVPTTAATDSFLRQPRRGLVVGATEDARGPRLFGMDIRHARHRLAEDSGHARLLMPSAYALDDLTLGALWAMSNLDQALLDDDAAVNVTSQQFDVYERSLRSTVGHEVADDLTAVSRMWLGSDFCARHIMRNIAALSEPPAFWTREQHGEEASTWLLFAHKYAYLSQLARRADPAAPFTRAFCIPPTAVAGSGQPERILLLLAVALMESFGTRVEVCPDPEYTVVPGFVIDQHRNAILANWVGTENMWQVDVTDTRPMVREFADATGHAHAHSLATAPSPGVRLRALADYLGLDWTWLVGRCGELGDYGSAGIIQPRSRLLSVEGLDRACRFLVQTQP